MVDKLTFKRSATKDLRRIGLDGAHRILQALREKLLPDPRTGKALKGKDGVLWSFRVGEYQVIYTFSDRDLLILVIRRGHRREIYR